MYRNPASDSDTNPLIAGRSVAFVSRALLLAGTLLLAAACAAGDTAGEAASEPLPAMPPPNAPASSAMPLLPAGTHFGTIVAFEPLPEATRSQVELLWQEALDAGMQTGRIHLDWATVEKGPDRYDKEALRSRLLEKQRDGLRSFVGIYTVDTNGLTLPPDLMDKHSPTGISGGRSLDDPDILRRYRRMLDWAVPMIVRHGGYVLSLSNEPKEYMDQHREEADNVIRFFRKAGEQVRRIDERLAVTVTLTGAPIHEKTFFHDGVMAAVDVATYNYYGLDMTDRFVLRSPFEETVPRDLKALVEASAGKEVLLQELGCPAGWSGRPSVIGSNREAQKRFFRTAFAAARRLPELRAAYVFQMVDWSEDLTDTYVRGSIGGERLPEPFVKSFEEWLATSGLIGYERGRVRPAWYAFVDALEAGESDAEPQ
jgi:hypothetical protein